jgi:hypothetical protein
VTHDPLTPLRYADLGILAVALPIFLATGLPILGWAVAAVVWIAWRTIGAYADRKAAASNDPRTVAGIETGSMIGRGWLMGLTIFGAGMAFGDDVGLSAAVLAVVLFTVSFTTRLITRPFDAAHPKEPTPTR